MTEGILAVQTENDTGCNVGKPLECMQVKFFEAENVVIENTGANNSVISYEIGIKGDCLCSGYYKDADLYANSFKDGYFLTGDIGYEDEVFLLRVGYFLFSLRLNLHGGRKILPSVRFIYHLFTAR